MVPWVGGGRSWGLVVVVLVVFAVHGRQAQADRALDKRPFTATPAELLASAKLAPAGDWPVVVLRDDYDTSVDAQGRATLRRRIVFVVRAQAGVDEWGTVVSSWSPFYQDKPVIRARVIEPGGKVSELDPSLITDTPAVQTSPTMYSDRRRLDAPLPRLQVGVVVEEQIIVQDRLPLLSAGTVEAVTIGNFVPTVSTRVWLDVPAARKVKHHARGLPAGLTPRHVVAGGRERWTYEVGRMEPLPGWEAFLPGDTEVLPTIGIATAPSWAAVARDYRKLLDQRIAAGPHRLPAQLPTTPSIETVRAIVAWLHREIRYTGIEFGEASIIPWTPAETVKRGFGDCKDKATLLIAMLRQVGVRADLVLLSTGPGTDLDPTLPGMGVFDHAIVRARVGTTEVWIDATEDLLAAGQLPSRDQRRLALVVADDVTALTTTPGAKPADNLVREIRTFELSETDTARVTEVSREGGVFEASARSWIRDTRTEDLRKQLTSYVEQIFAAKALERHATTAPTDLAIPMEVTTVASSAARGSTVRDRIDVYLYPRETLLKVPDVMTAKPDPAAPRRSPIAWFTPHVYEIENRLIVPLGYSPPALPGDRTRTLGTATLVERYRLDGRTVVVTFRFDSGKLRLTPTELAALQKELRALDGEHVHIRIEHTAWALAERGKPREAIAEIERVIKLHPKEAIHQTQLAFVLLKAGAIPAARRAARKAVQLEPRNADAYAMLAWVLRHDSFGREFGFDHDRAGALAAYQQARKHNPKHVGAAVDHATFLERSTDGELFARGADLRAAVVAWRAAKALDDTAENTLGLVRALMWSGQFREAETLATATTSSERRDSLLVAATAMARDPATAIGLVTTLRTGAARSTLFDAAAATLMSMRHYDASRALFALGTVRSGSPQDTMIQRLTHHDKPLAIGGDPRLLAIELMRAVMEPTRPNPAFQDEAILTRLRQQPERRATMLAQVRVLGPSLLLDFLRSTHDATAAGRGAGPWRVMAAMNGLEFRYYAALHKGAAKVIAVPEAMDGLGRHVLGLVSAKDEVGARQCLDWARADLDAGIARDPSFGGFAKLWGPGLATGSDAIALAAAALAGSSDPDRTLPIVRRCATRVAEGAATCDLLIALTLGDAERWQELDRHAAGWVTRQPAAASPANNLRTLALTRLGKLDDAAKLADERLASDPTDRSASMHQVEIALARRRPEEAIRILELLATRAGAIPEDKNNLAWVRAAYAADLPRALEQARAAVQQAPGSDSAMNTLAVVEAALGDLHAAMVDGVKSMALGGRDVPGEQDWYLIGRVQEQLGLEADAIDAYRKVVSTPAGFIPTAHDFARARLAALTKNPPPSPRPPTRN